MPIMKVEEQFEKMQKYNRQGEKMKKIRENRKPSYDRITKEKVLEIFNS